MSTLYPHRRSHSEHSRSSRNSNLSSSTRLSPAASSDPDVLHIVGDPAIPSDVVAWNAGRDMLYVYTKQSELAETLLERIGRCTTYFQKGRAVAWHFLMSGRVLRILQDKYRFSIRAEDEKSMESLVESKRVTGGKKSKYVARPTNRRGDGLGDHPTRKNHEPTTNSNTSRTETQSTPPSPVTPSSKPWPPRGQLKLWISWNRFALDHDLQVVETFPAERRAKITARLAEKRFKIVPLLEAIERQPYLLGANEQGWKIDFDWLVANPDNYVTVLQKLYAAERKCDATGVHRISVAPRLSIPVTTDEISEAREIDRADRRSSIQSYQDSAHKPERANSVDNPHVTSQGQTDPRMNPGIGKDGPNTLRNEAAEERPREEAQLKIHYEIGF